MTYPRNSIENMAYNVTAHQDGGRLKLVEFDARLCSDNVWVVNHDTTFVYEGVTYNIFETPSSIAIAAGLPLAESFLQYARRYGVGLYIDFAGANNDPAKLQTLTDLVEHHNMVPYVWLGTPLMDEIATLRQLCPTCNIAIAKFRKSDVDQQTLADISANMTGNLMVFVEARGNTGNVTLDDGDYIRWFQERGMSFGIHTITLDKLDTIADWANLVDFICTDSPDPYPYILSFDFGE